MPTAIHHNPRVDIQFGNVQRGARLWHQPAKPAASRRLSNRVRLARWSCTPVGSFGLSIMGKSVISEPCEYIYSVNIYLH